MNSTPGFKAPGIIGVKDAWRTGKVCKEIIAFPSTGFPLLSYLLLQSTGQVLDPPNGTNRNGRPFFDSFSSAATHTVAVLKAFSAGTTPPPK